MKIWLTITTASIVLLGVGCTQLDNALLEQQVKEEVTVQTNLVTQLLPNGLLFTNIFVMVSTNYYTNYVTNPNAEAVVKATDMIPIYGGLISAIGTTLLGFYRAVRNRKIAEAAVIAVDAGRRAVRALDGGGDKVDGVFKDAMVREQQALGMQPDITAIVRQRTQKTT
jgi:hypothetical protein